MRFRKLVAAGAVSGSLVAGAVVGAVLFAPGLGAAQETPTPSAEESRSPHESTSATEGVRGYCLKGALLEAAAEAIGIEEADLLAALRDGQTIAEVAEANGVSVQTVVDALLAEASAAIDRAIEDGRLTQEEADEKKADLEERMTDLVNGELPLRGPHRWGLRFRMPSTSES